MIRENEPESINKDETILFKKRFNFLVSEVELRYELTNNAGDIELLTFEVYDAYTIIVSLPYSKCLLLTDDILALTCIKSGVYGSLAFSEVIYSGSLKVNKTNLNISHEEKVLSAIEAVLEGRATRQETEYSIAGRSLKLMSIKELTDAREYYKALVDDLKLSKQNKKKQNKIQVRF